ncbi:uncharacterized protein LOC111026575 [Myzus persicae]|uniref:uncharacterized protein LOC111026575 n=1 Tax=Myzus persicae TaxID=13164 RepID=UPI000B937BEF|nr:uncharacterized protein LOC111026575 [Myzus persicae]XP_022160370.1 uncharacterized protein LOC111026575 [Myzus persicae]
MWFIVHFINDNSVSAVPKSWWKHGYCAWPKKNIKNKNKLIESMQKPNKIDYVYFKARLLTQNPIASYNEARCKALKAQNTSDLSSTENVKFKFKTKTKKKPPINDYSSAPEFSDSSDGVFDDSDKDKLYSPECSKKFDLSPSYNVIGNVDKNNELSSNKVFIIEDNTDIINSPSGKWKVQSNYISPIPNISINKCNNEYKVSSSKQLSKIKKCLFPSNTNSMEEDIIMVNDKLSTGELEVAGTDLSLNEVSHLAYEFKQCYDYTKTSLTNIKFDIKNLVYTVNEIKSMVEHTVNVLTTSGSLNNHQDNRSNSNLLNTENVPISNEQTLENVETELENSTTRSQVVNELSRLVGRSISDSVRRMMQKLFDDTWLKYYSYVGHKGKNKLSSLNSCKIIFEAIHLCSKFEKVPDIEIALSISKWMAQASNRLKKKYTNTETTITL